MSNWTAVTTVSPQAAQATFASAIVEAGTGPAYVTIESGRVAVRHDLEQANATPLKELVVLAWEPGKGHIMRIAFPMWFVRVKTNDSINLGTLISVLSRDWSNLELSISTDDLARRGPGLVLDHTREDGGRVLLWTTPPEQR